MEQPVKIDKYCKIVLIRGSRAVKFIEPKSTMAVPKLWGRGQCRVIYLYGELSFCKIKRGKARD